MKLIVNALPIYPGEIGHMYVSFVLCYEFFLELYCVLLLLYQWAGTRNFLWPHGGLFSSRTQETMDYYEMFRMNADGDAHSMRNKGRLSHECMGCLVWAIDSSK